MDDNSVSRVSSKPPSTLPMRTSNKRSREDDEQDRQKIDMFGPRGYITTFPCSQAAADIVDDISPGTILAMCHLYKKKGFSFRFHCDAAAELASLGPAPLTPPGSHTSLDNTAPVSSRSMSFGSAGGSGGWKSGIAIERFNLVTNEVEATFVSITQAAAENKVSHSTLRTQIQKNVHYVISPGIVLRKSALPSASDAIASASGADGPKDTNSATSFAATQMSSNSLSSSSTDAALEAGAFEPSTVPVLPPIGLLAARSRSLLDSSHPRRIRGEDGMDEGMDEEQWSSVWDVVPSPTHSGRPHAEDEEEDDEEEGEEDEEDEEGEEEVGVRGDGEEVAKAGVANEEAAEEVVGDDKTVGAGTDEGQATAPVGCAGVYCSADEVTSPAETEIDTSWHGNPNIDQRKAMSDRIQDLLMSHYVALRQLHPEREADPEVLSYLAVNLESTLFNQAVNMVQYTDMSTLTERVRSASDELHSAILRSRGDGAADVHDAHCGLDG